MERAEMARHDGRWMGKVFFFFTSTRVFLFFWIDKSFSFERHAVSFCVRSTRWVLSGKKKKRMPSPTSIFYSLIILEDNGKHARCHRIPSTCDPRARPKRECMHWHFLSTATSSSTLYLCALLVIMSRYNATMGGSLYSIRLEFGSKNEWKATSRHPSHWT